MNALVLAEQKVPRYTSYPTAPHFSASVGPRVYADWLATLRADSTLSLYFHVPYCAELCLYCGCHTKMVRRREPIDAYAARLKTEIALVARLLGARRVVHIHWGGGTPSILGPAVLIDIAAQLRDTFDLSAVREHAIELDPRRIERPLVEALARMGVNRVSLGVQDFTPRVQEAIGRVQPFGTVLAALSLLDDFGIKQRNFDLMYGLPNQSVHDVRRSAGLAGSLGPQRIALFGYAHVPWFKPQQRLIDAAALPGAGDRLAQAEAARVAFVECGYWPIGLDHFALPGDELAIAAGTGTLRRNFQGYTTDTADALIGIGASAIGRLPQGYVQNAPAPGNYGSAIDAGRLATTRGLALSAEDRIRGRIIERLLCGFAVDLGAIAVAAQAAGMDHFEAEMERLEALALQGLIELEGGQVRVTEKGRPFVRLVAAVFDAYLPTTNARHSVAV